jgi:glycosyltransferase involved in cell wall biosynthesis
VRAGGPAAIVPRPDAEVPLNVTILHNYRDDQQPSMRLYAERLGAALQRRNVHLTRVRPFGVVPDSWRARSSAWAKFDGYVGRFAVYPRLVRNLTADVVHIVDHGQGYLVANLDERRTVVTCHDVILLALASGRIGSVPVPPIALQMLRMAVQTMKRAAAVVADSSQTKRDLVRFVGIDPARITVIHPGLNQDFRPDRDAGRALRQRLGLGDGLLVLQIGRGFYKNLAGVLNVLHRLRRDGVEVRLVRVGPGLAGKDLALARRLGLLDQVIELGRMIPDQDLPALYNAVDVLLFPSVYEGFGWPPLEAMASGTPVVCSRAGSLDEVVGTAALTADPEDDEALAWHVGAVLHDRALRDTLIARGLARAAEFNWDRTAAQVLGVYRDVIARAA